MDKESIKSIYLDAPSEHLHPSLIKYVEQWDDSPSALQVFRLLQNLGGKASSFTIEYTQQLFISCCANQGQTQQEVAQEYMKEISQ